jgi:hypothetical protein
MKNTIKYICVFSTAMALLEAAVVIYLRELYYPDGFPVAMKLIKEQILITELAREAATVVMLYALAIIAGRTNVERFSYFLLSFAVWDIFYYFWLKVFLNWPEGLFTWDILFLLPVTWLAPVLAPLLCSITMIVLSLILLCINQQKQNYHLRSSDWLFLASGSFLILYTFIKDYSTIIIQNGWLLEIGTLVRNSKFTQLTSTYIPVSYDWLVFGIGFGIILLGIVIITIRDLEFKPSFYKGL